MTTHCRRYDDLTDADLTPDEAVTLVERWEDVPAFTSEDEAAAWWDTHSLADHLWTTTRRGPPEHLAQQAAAERRRRGFASTQRATTSPTPGGPHGLSGSQVVAGIVLGGLLLAGGAYLLSALLKGQAAPASFLPTGSPHLVVSPPRSGGVLRELAGLPHLAQVR